VTEPFATALVLTAAGLLLALAGLASPLPGRLGVPALLLFLLVGMAAGSEGIGGIPFEDYELSFRLGCVALALILFDGGLNTPLAVLRRVAGRASALATLGVLLTALLVGGVGVALGLAPGLAFLVGAVVSSTDAAAVFAVLRSSGVRLKHSTAATLEVESGLNDPMAMFLTVVATEALLAPGAAGAGEALRLFVEQLVLGAGGGVGVGLLGRFALRAVRLPAAGLYPVVTVAVAFLSFGGASLVGGSGFLAVYLAGIALASGPLPYRAGVRRVHDSLAWLSQILMFVLLGLLVFPSRLLPDAGLGLALALALAFVARPLAVAALLAPFRPGWRESVFVSWVGLRGAVPIVLATYPVLRGIPSGDELFHLVFFVVVVNGLVPGATVGAVARWLGIARAAAPPAPASLELVSLREFPGEFIWYLVHPVSAVAGACVRDLSLPEGCLVVLLLRGEQVVVPRGSTQLEAGDQVCALVTPEARRLLDLLFGAGGEDEA
jgi:cell volume regulation protein A